VQHLPEHGQREIPVSDAAWRQGRSAEEHRLTLRWGQNNRQDRGSHKAVAVAAAVAAAAAAGAAPVMLAALLVLLVLLVVLPLAVLLVLLVHGRWCLAGEHCRLWVDQQPKDYLILVKKKAAVNHKAGSSSYLNLSSDWPASGSYPPLSSIGCALVGVREERSPTMGRGMSTLLNQKANAPTFP
jgi:hypothetical protein